MKKTQIYNVILLLWLLLLSLATFTPAATPNYVGIQENDTFTFDVMYDEDVLEDYWEDYWEEVGVPESAIDNWIDNNIDVDEDIIGIRIVILDVDDEEKDPWGEDGVRIIYNFHENDEDKGWDLEEKDETWGVWDYDEDVYVGLWNFGFWWELDDDGALEKLESENAWFISTKIDWDEIEEELEEFYEDDADYEDVSVKIDKDNKRIVMELDEDEDDDVEKEGYIIEYDDNGVLMYYEESYNGDPIVIVQTQESQIREFISDNMIWIIIGAVGIVAVIVVIVVVVFKRGK